eukprot:15481822-Alexandrium_andersonii.AAC.1
MATSVGLENSRMAQLQGVTDGKVLLAAGVNGPNVTLWILCSWVVAYEPSGGQNVSGVRRSRLAAMEE